jgi:hypothetical protein
VPAARFAPSTSRVAATWALDAAAAVQRSHAQEPPAALRASVLAAITSVPQERSAVDQRVIPLDAERSRRRFRPAMLAAAAVALFAVGGVVVVVTNDDERSDPVAAVVEAPDASARTLSGEIDALTVIYSPSQAALVVEGGGVPVLDETATDQLWLVGDDGATSVGTFRPDEDGRVSERFGDAGPTDFVLGVTREPAGGSESPTLPILASA